MARKTELSFFIPGKPVGKGRPRFGRGFAYTPKKTVDQEKLVKGLAKQAMKDGDHSLIGTSVAVHLIARWPIPESWPKWKRQLARDQDLFPGKPDLDNVCKLVLDAMNGTVYKDDDQVILLSIIKAYAEEPGIWVFVMWDTGEIFDERSGPQLV
jgi:Holliday junction resolvase RusA-like endonuclease